jgi:hypothetical protein
MEIDPDTVPWYDELVTIKPTIENGYLVLPAGPGWGTEVDEETVRPPAAVLSRAPLALGDQALVEIGAGGDRLDEGPKPA